MDLWSTVNSSDSAFTRL